MYENKDIYIYINIQNNHRKYLVDKLLNLCSVVSINVFSSPVHETSNFVILSLVRLFTLHNTQLTNLKCEIK